MTPIRIALILLFAATSAPAQKLVLDVDHIIVGIDSLDRGIRQLRDLTGLTAVYGGAHPGRGTHNALLSLGSGKYLEILAPNPNDTVRTATTAALAKYQALTPFGFAVRMPNADTVRAELVRRGLPVGDVQPGSRLRSDGLMLRWRTLAPWGPSAHQMLPFFIEWMPGPHPSTDSPTGCTLYRLLLGSPDPALLSKPLDAADVPVTVRRARFDGMAVELTCRRVRVQLSALQ